MLSFVEKISFSKKDAIVAIEAKDYSGRDFYHVVKTDAKGYEQMQRDYKQKQSRKISEYGEVIYSGWGEVPEDLIEAIKDDAA